MGSFIVAGDRLVGVIGGMGPEATVDFMSRVIAATPAEADQDHIRMLVDHNPRIPSRQSAMRREGEDPGMVLASIAARLEAGGADFIVMPCNLAHAWASEIRSALTIPFVSIVDETVSRALHHKQSDAIGLLTTPGCFSAGLYQDALAGHELVLQSPDELAATMRFVARIKAGDKSDDVAQGLRGLAGNLLSKGAQCLIAACTEFPLVLDAAMFEVPFISSTDVLAEATVALALSDEPNPQ
ncbi:MAG: aspartate/glutamate racemase family protein [Woeseiaceae bacterium]